MWLGNESGFRRPSLEREVQLDVRVLSSSRGSLRDVVHSPLKGSTIVAVGVFACGGSFTPEGTYDSMGQRVADDWKILHRLFPVPGDVGCLHAE